LLSPLFEEGDSVARVDGGRARGLGVVIEGGERARQALRRRGSEGGRKTPAARSGAAIAYDLQLSLIETYLGGMLAEVEDRLFRAR
jgi:hypothetical protein